LRLSSGFRFDSTDFMTGLFLMSISAFCCQFFFITLSVYTRRTSCSILSGAGPDRFWSRSAQKQERQSEPKLCFFCPVNNARIYKFPVRQISRNSHTIRGSVSRWIFSENIFETLPVRGLFSKKINVCVKSSTISDFRPRYLRNDYKSRKLTHDRSRQYTRSAPNFIQIRSISVEL